MDEFLDYEEYARSFPDDESLISVLEGHDIQERCVRNADMESRFFPDSLPLRQLSYAVCHRTETSGFSFGNLKACKRQRTSTREKKRVDDLQTAQPAPDHSAHTVHQNPPRILKSPSYLREALYRLTGTIPMQQLSRGLTPDRKRCDLCFR